MRVIHGMSWQRFAKLFAIVMLGYQLLTFGAMAWAAGLDASRLDRAPVSLTEHFAILEDPEQTLTLADMSRPEIASRFITGQAPGETLNFGYTTSAYWLRLRLDNPSDQAVERMLELVTPYLYSIQFHQPKPDQTYRTILTGRAWPFTERPYANRNFVFPLLLPPQSSTLLYLQIKTPDQFRVPARLWSRTGFQEHERRDYALQAWYFGMVLALVVFNALLYVFLHDTRFLLYLFFGSCVAFTSLSNTGLGTEFVWGNLPTWSMVSTHVGVSVAEIALLLFMRRMFFTRRLVPRLDHLLKLAIGLNLAFLALVPVAFAEVARVMSVLHGLTALLTLVTSVVCALMRKRSAYFFVVAFAVLCLAVLLNTVHVLGIRLPGILVSEAPQLGSALALTLMAFALVDGFYVMLRKKSQAQRQALFAQEATLVAQAEALHAEQAVVEALRSSERLLEGRVNERTAELTTTVEHLQRTRDDLVQTEKLASLGALVAGVAKELTLPITNALAAASGLARDSQEFKGLLARGELNKASLNYFVDGTVHMAEAVARSCQHAGSLISSFKQVAVDQTSEQRRTFNLRAVVDDNIAALRPSFQQASLILTNNVPEGLVCDSYPGPMGQVLANLIQNAVTHAFAGRDGGEIKINAALRGKIIEMTIRDDGVGMDAAVLARIFEPFYSAHEGHTGLGLSISLNLVTGVLGGSLQAAAETDRGSCFTVRFPLTAPDRTLHSSQQLSQGTRGKP